jgi:ketosteroid isomerase-like protein
MTEETVRQEITRLEKRRCDALTSGDVAALAALMAEDLVHIHGSGQMDGKTAYLDGVANKFTFHSIERGELKIRDYGNLVVVNGPLKQTVSVKGVDKLNHVSAIVTQTWVLGSDCWKQNTCHMAFLSVT